MIKNSLLKINQKYKALTILKAVLWGTIIATLFVFVPGSQDTEAWSSFDPVFATVATILRGKVGVALAVSASGCFVAEHIRAILSVF